MDRKVFYNGTILTMQAEGHTVEAVYTIGDRIAAIGNRDDVFRQITDDTERVDLEGKTLIPGFIESHAHVTDWAECEFLQFTCYHIKNIAELQDMIRENAKTKKAGEWVIGYGYNDSMVAEMRHLERADIDAACADHPVFVMHGSGHLAYVNSKALEICNIHADTPIPAGGQGEIHLGADGLPSGLLIGQAYNLALSVIPKNTRAHSARASPPPTPRAYAASGTAPSATWATSGSSSGLSMSWKRKAASICASTS